ncbi:MAG: LysR family transcriptional regulator [Maritimibacter sp.]
MSDWDELRTAYEVARHGTVSGAAAALGVHHATVIRHVDALEARLGVKLFQRHARGYTPTEAGQELARVAQATDDQFTQLAARLTGQGDAVSGELVVTSLTGFSPLLMPILSDFMQIYPDVRLRYRTGRRLFRLEYGEAHVAIRAAARQPNEPDNVAQHMASVEFAPFATQSYVDRMGMPTDESFSGHDFIGPDEPETGAPAMRWTEQNIPPERVKMRVSDDIALLEAIRAGIGIGFLGVNVGEKLVQLAEPRPEWQVHIWLVTHVDLHRTAKVQALSSHLKKALKAKQAAPGASRPMW